MLVRGQLGHFIANSPARLFPQAEYGDFNHAYRSLKDGLDSDRVVALLEESPAVAYTPIQGSWFESRPGQSALPSAEAGKFEPDLYWKDKSRTCISAGHREL